MGFVNMALTSCLETEGTGRETSGWWVLTAGSVESSWFLESPVGWDVRGIRKQSRICVSVNKTPIWEVEDLGF